MMRDDDDDVEPSRPPAPYEQKFASSIEEDLGYEIDDPVLRDEIAEEVYNPKPQPEFGFDATIMGGDPNLGPHTPLAQPKAYAANKGSFGTTGDESDDKPTNLVASSRGYVMPKSLEEAGQADEEIENKFGYRTPQDPPSDEEDSDEDRKTKKKSKREKKEKEKKKDTSCLSPHKPYSQLDTVAEDGTGEAKYDAPSKKIPSNRSVGNRVDRIKVAVRLRPMTKAEMVSKSKKKKEGGPEAFMGWEIDDDGDFDVIFQRGVRSKVEGKSMFHVDRVYEERDFTEALYADVCRPIMTAVLSGQHGTIFGYGQTGGGKSYTIQGGKGADGVIQLAAKDLFQQISADTSREYSVKASYFEIYNEQVRDLMGHDENDNPKSRRATAVVTAVNKLNVDLPVLSIREDSKGGDVFVDAQFTKVTTIQNIVRVLHKGNRNRATEETKSNKFSSRSHAIFRLTVESHERIDEDTDVAEGIKLRVAALNFVDLAGSENAAKASTSGKAKREGGKINQSLLSLSQVIHQLSLPPKKQPKHINYRDSKLTRILQPHLSGNAAITIICCCTPAKKMLEETRATLKFAYSAKRIKLKPQINEIVDDKILIENLKKELQETRMRLADLKDYQEKNPPNTPGESEYPMIERFFAQMSAHMNASIRSEDFVDAVEELSGVTICEKSGGSGEEGAASVSAVSPVVALRSEEINYGSAENDESCHKDDDEDDVEAFRRQILARFMSDGYDEEEDLNDTNNDDSVTDNTVDVAMANCTTLGNTTLADKDKDDGETSDYGTALNRTDATEPDASEAVGTQQLQDTRVVASTTVYTSAKEAMPAFLPARQSAHETAGQPPLLTLKVDRTVQFEAVGPNQLAAFSSHKMHRDVLHETTKGENHVDEIFRSKMEEPEEVCSKRDGRPDSQDGDTPHKAVKRSFIDSDESSDEKTIEVPNESELNLVERFRVEILEKFRDEIVDEEAAHELDENAQNVAVIANELINKFKREIVYKYKDEFPEVLVKRVEADLSAKRVGDQGIVGRVIERTAVGQSPESEPQVTAPSVSTTCGSCEKFEDEFDEELPPVDANFDKPEPRRSLPGRSYSTQTDRAVVNGEPEIKLSSGKEGGFSAESDPPKWPGTTWVGHGRSGSIGSDLSSDVADKKVLSTPHYAPADSFVDEHEDEALVPLGEIAVSFGEETPSVKNSMHVKFLEEKLLATDELVETLFVELENAKSLVREVVFASAGGAPGGVSMEQSGAALFGPTGTSGVTVVDEQILQQCEILKFGIYTSLLFFVFGQHELFLATVFFLWLSLEVATKT